MRILYRDDRQVIVRNYVSRYVYEDGQWRRLRSLDRPLSNRIKYALTQFLARNDR